MGFPIRKGVIIILVLLVGCFIFGKALFGTNEIGKGYESNKTQQSIHILAGIDSLTNGRLYSTNKSRYLDDFIPKLKTTYGDGGPGYIPFDTKFFKQEGGTLIFTNGLKEINNLPHDMYPAPYSFDFKGLYTNFGESFSMTVRLKNAWHYGKVFYLKQPHGGTFVVGYPNGKTIRINTQGKTGLGVLNLPRHRKRLPLIINKIQGKVVLFGGYFFNSNGVVVSRVGQGGDQLAWYSELNRNQLSDWIQALKPDLFIFNGGMNDRNYLSGSLYEQALINYLTPFQQADCPLILTIPNAINGNQMTLNKYEAILRAYAKEHHTGLVSNKSVLGRTFQKANAKGYMADKVHPNEKGATMTSRNLLSYIKNHSKFHHIFLEK